MNQTETFGSFVRDRRLALGMTLRVFATSISQDPSNVSRIERGQLTPPQDPATLRRIADALAFDKTSDERLRLFDLAAVGSRRIPADIANDPELMARLPALFRSLRIVTAPDRDQLDALKDTLRGLA